MWDNRVQSSLRLKAPQGDSAHLSHAGGPPIEYWVSGPATFRETRARLRDQTLKCGTEIQSTHLKHVKIYCSHMYVPNRSVSTRIGFVNHNTCRKLCEFGLSTNIRRLAGVETTRVKNVSVCQISKSPRSCANACTRAQRKGARQRLWELGIYFAFWTSHCGALHPTTWQATGMDRNMFSGFIVPSALSPQKSTSIKMLVWIVTSFNQQGGLFLRFFFFCSFLKSSFSQLFKHNFHQNVYLQLSIQYNWAWAFCQWPWMKMSVLMCKSVKSVIISYWWGLLRTTTSTIHPNYFLQKESTKYQTGSKSSST